MSPEHSTSSCQRTWPRPGGKLTPGADPGWGCGANTQYPTLKLERPDAETTCSGAGKPIGVGGGVQRGARDPVLPPRGPNQTGARFHVTGLKLQRIRAAVFAKPKFKDRSQVRRVKARPLGSPASGAKPNGLRELRRAAALPPEAPDRSRLPEASPNPGLRRGGACILHGRG